eukprot:CAMPEP_0184857624 /NCGR_PEP_ID=MMETSP0580-20130426/2777_1 /TAXON_ID=1118495 /ORGANISM="Dactyliosolen fragilissimus" /LENGTH=319 /DNA_ID=CAMNT_0027353327 /DNA_START=91 /DNA_END=1050 /DNA_ORIENTATION=+
MTTSTTAVSISLPMAFTLILTVLLRPQQSVEAFTSLTTTSYRILQEKPSSTAFVVSSNPIAATYTRTNSFSSSSSSSSCKASTTSTSSETTTTSFIDTELRGAAMKLHTRAQAPKEGQAIEKPAPKQPYVTQLSDYFQFLIDSRFVYQTFEEVLKLPDLLEETSPFVNTGLERSSPLDADIDFLLKEYPEELKDFANAQEVGPAGREYADLIRRIAVEGGKERVPELMCHYYNHYFAHTAGGRMIGKQMSALLLNKKTLEFYKWDEDINKIKTTVKNSFEEMAAKWTREQKDMCVDATAAAFRGGGSINAYLRGGSSPH